MIEIIKLLLLIGHFFIKRKDPKYHEEFLKNVRKINKSFADRDIDSINITTNELLREARSALRGKRNKGDKK